jgi:hypothetical protein
MKLCDYYPKLMPATKQPSAFVFSSGFAGLSFFCFKIKWRLT